MRRRVGCVVPVLRLIFPDRAQSTNMTSTETMSDLVSQDKEIIYFVSSSAKKSENGIKATLESQGTIFPYMTDDHITTLEDITGTLKGKKGLATCHSDLFQAKTSKGDRVRLFAIRQEDDSVAYFYSSRYELLAAKVLKGGQTRAAELQRELGNRVPGSDHLVIFSEEIAKAAMKQSKVKKSDEMVESEDEVPQVDPAVTSEEEEKKPKKRGRPPSKDKKAVKPKKRGRPAEKTTDKKKPRGRPAKKPTMAEILSDYEALGKKLKNFTSEAPAKEPKEESEGEVEEEVLLEF